MPAPPAPAALLHGLPTSGALWSPVRAALDRPTWAPDLPGYGGAPPLPLPRHGVDDHLDALDAARHAVGGAPWADHHLVGTDYGGLLALEAAARWGARSVTLISCATGLGWLPPRLLALPGVQRVAYRRYGGRRWVRRSVPAAQHDRFRDTVCGALSDPHLPERMRATAAALSPARCATLLGRCPAPLRLIWGDADPHYPLWRARRAARRAGAPLTVVPGGGHALPWTHPEAVCRALEAGWASVSSGRSS